MRLPSPLLKGKLIRRYKRFLADIELENGEIITAHCANSGSMLTVNKPGLFVWVSKAPEGSKRKLGYTWELVEANNTLIGIFPAKCNDIVEEALQHKVITELNHYSNIQREVKYADRSRIDFLLTAPGLPDCYLEVKGVHMRRTDHAEFPDAKTARGVKHLDALAQMKAEGHRAVVLYCVQRNDCDTFMPAHDIDPDYAAKTKEVCKKGVEELCYSCRVTCDEITLTRPLSIIDF
tara:strand:+ start:1272 stop:1976 length:705 start_codon:yes stop_codon:yes gene_type:complete